MSSSRQTAVTYPLTPLLAAFREATRAAETPGVDRWLTGDFLDTADPQAFVTRLTDFYHAAVPDGWHADAVPAYRGILRHGLGHLVRGTDPLPDRLDRCLRPGGAYFVPGLGRTFWAAAVQAAVPTRPRWTPAVEAGARRVGLLPARLPVGSAAAFGVLCDGYAALLRSHPDLSAPRLDAFFAAVARMRGREIDAVDAPPEPDRLPDRLRAVRNRTPLRRRLTEEGRRRGEAAAAARAALDAGDLDRLVTALLAVVPGEVAGVAAEVLIQTVEAEWYARLRERCGPAAACQVLSLWPATGLVPLTAAALDGLARLDDAFAPGLLPADELALLRSAIGRLRDRHRVHPLEMSEVLEAAAAADDEPAAGRFGGFCTDTFRFLAGLAANNTRAWMDAERDRYLFAVREPLVELCEALAERYVRPVLGGEYGWALECDARPGKAITSIAKNDYGRSAPYQTAVWVTFYPAASPNRQRDAQLFVRIDADGVAFGFRLAPTARDAGRRLRAAVRDHAALLFDALQAADAFTHVRFGEDGRTVRSAEDLRAWAAGRTLLAARSLPPETPALRTEELVGEVLLAFDRLVPLFAAAVEPDPVPVLRRRAGRPAGSPAYDREAFLRDTFLPEVWLDRAVSLLALKRQLVLQGVSGTGKTHVARALARLLAKDRPDAVRFVQFHPAYSYAEFVESATPGPDGPAIRDGVLTEFAGVASRHPAETFVLVVDDMARGNLPTVFGELLYLLEYRGQAVTLPFSQRPFRLPDNLLLMGTVNTADPAAAPLGQPLRRRFGFVEMPPDAALLARWLEAHPPADPDPAFGPRVVRLFEQLNARLARDGGPDRQVGHSPFMVPGLDAAKLRTVWDHHVRPLLDATRPDRHAGFDLDRLFAVQT
jgi:MoxR-like ATPase/uncharacterized protein (DUF2461 family)